MQNPTKKTNIVKKIKKNMKCKKVKKNKIKINRLGFNNKEIK